jgi:hypothetical protein
MRQQILLPGFVLLFIFPLSAQDYVTLYEQCNYSGKSYALTAGNYRGYQMKVDNDRLASILIPAGMTVTIYEHDEFNGRSATYTSGISCLPPEWRNTVSSIIVNGGNYNQSEYVTFYNDCSYRGYSQVLRPGSYPGSQLGMLKNNISSFAISGNLQVRLFFNNEFFSGSGQLYDISQGCLPSGQNDRVESLIIEYRQEQPSYPGGNDGGNYNNQYATFFADCNYNGNALRLSPGYYQGNELGLLKYNIASVQVPSGLRVKVFLNSEYHTGQASMIYSNSSCLGSNLQNRIGSVIVEETNSYPNYPGPGNNDGSRVIIYDLEDFQGRSASLLPGTYRNMREAGFIDNALSSLTVPSGYRVVLYEFENFGGKSYTITNTKNKFYISGWSNKTSSIAVYRDR